MNPGKQFEADFKKSVPHDFWFYRFKDGTANWSNQDQSQTRFQAKNICDCELYSYPNLFLLELKSTKQKSLPFGNVRDNQLDELSKASQFNGIHAGFIVNFREVNETYYLPVNGYAYYKMTLASKSIPLKIFRENCYLIPQALRIKHYRYDVKQFIIDITKGVKNAEIQQYERDNIFR